MPKRYVLLTDQPGELIPNPYMTVIANNPVVVREQL
jgi:hypothetical protein